MNWPFGDLQPFSGTLLAIDPPWPFVLYSDAGSEKSASAHYQTMSMEEIAALPVGHLAQGDCLVLLWATGAILPEAIDILRGWGAVYKSEMVWVKRTKNGKIRVGTGYRCRSMHEPVLIGTYGNPVHKPFPSVFDGLARRHSEKPEEFYEMCERHMPNAKKIELFSRRSRKGWQTFGDQSTLFDTDEPVTTKRDRPAPAIKNEPMSLFAE